jgi:predicted nucleotidyltransferase component of viral defense system
MLSKIDVVNWRKNVDWATDDQVEQDLIISICLVKIFNNPYLKDRLAFRGGTALNKLVFPKPLRYSEDIDMNRLENDSAGPMIDAIRDVLKDLFPKKASYKSTDQSIKLAYTYPSIVVEDRKVKIEINVRETLPQEDIINYPFEVRSEFFTGRTDIRGFSKEEMIGTKIRALSQRKKGRDLFDLYELGKLDLDWAKIIQSFKKLNIGATREDFEENMKEKMADSIFLEDMRPLLPSSVKYDVVAAYEWFKCKIIPML